MANLRIKDQYTNLILSNGLIQATTETPTSKLRVGDSISQIGVKDGKLCVNAQSVASFNAGIRDKFGIPITSDGTVTDPAKFINIVRADSENSKIDIYPVTDFIVRFKMDGNDTGLTRVGGDDYVDGIACPDLVASQFDGSSQYHDIALTEIPKFDNAQNGCTIVSVFKTTTIVTDKGKGILAVGTAGASNNGFITRLSNDNKFQLSSNSVFSFKSSTSVNDGEWYFCVATYDGTEGNLYVNGILEDTETFTFNTIGGASNATIGSNSNGNDSFFDSGSIDEVVYYNRVLSTDEMAQLQAFRCG